jgi:hypothetical protein|tara:strand:- start:91 stop:804 length:714 start_codon:yes stop_codon:yes gene_type:complete
MALSDVRQTHLKLVNRVQAKLGLTETAGLATNKHAELLLDMLNEVIEDCSNFGDWQQFFREITVTAQSSVGTYEVAVSSEVKNIQEIAWTSSASPLEVRSIQDLRRLQRTGSGGGAGEPRQFAIVGVSGTNPLFRVYPTPASAQETLNGSFDIAYYKKPRLLVTTTADSTAITAFPANLLFQGLYAKAMLEQNGGEETGEYRTEYASYLNLRQEALNRFNSDTGTDVYFSPTGARYA